MEGSDAAFAFLRLAIGLKDVPRTGWLLRGVKGAESVAEHTWGTVLVTLVLASWAEPPLDREKALVIALLHDLPERILSDIPAPAARHLPAGAKRQAEESILSHMLADLPDAGVMYDWWQEYEDRSSPEGRLVRDADRLDMLLQARRYEENIGRRLDDFWEHQANVPFFTPMAQAVYEQLVLIRTQKDTR